MQGTVVESAMLRHEKEGWILFHWLEFDGGGSAADWFPHKDVTFRSAGGGGADGLEGRTEAVAGRFRLKRADTLGQHDDIDDTGAAGGLQGAKMASHNDIDSSEQAGAGDTQDHTSKPNRFPAVRELFLPTALRMPKCSPPELPAKDEEKDEAPSAAAAAAAAAHNDVLICAWSPLPPVQHCAASGQQQAALQLAAQWWQHCAAVVAALYSPGQLPLDGRDTVRFRQGKTAAGAVVTIAVAEVYVGKQTAGAQLKPLLVLVGQLSWHPDKHGGQLRAAVFGQHASASDSAGSTGGGGDGLQPWTGPELAMAALLLRPSTTAELFVLCDGQCWTAAAAAPTGARRARAQVWLRWTADDAHQCVQPAVKGGWVAELRGLGCDGYDPTTAAVQTDQRVVLVRAGSVERKEQEEKEEEMAAAANAAQAMAEKVARLEAELAAERERSRSLETRLQQLAPAAAAAVATASSPQSEEWIDSACTDQQRQQPQQPQHHQHQHQHKKVEFVKPSKMTIVCHPATRDRRPVNGAQAAAPNSANSAAAAAASRFKHWPHSVHFTSQAFYDTLSVRGVVVVGGGGGGGGGGGLCPAQLLARKMAIDFEMAGTEIWQITDPDHPCYCDAEHSKDGEYSYGLFATQDFPGGTFVGQYAGAIKPRQQDDTSRYLVPFCVDDTGVAFDVDAEHFGNEARFINDFHDVPMPTIESGGLARGAAQRATCKEANVEFIGGNCATTGQYFIAVMTKNKKKVKKGQEFLVDYGSGYFTKLSGSDSRELEESQEF